MKGRYNVLERIQSDRLNQPDILELLSYSVFPSSGAMGKAVALYKDQAEFELYGYKEGEVYIGIIGFQMDHAGNLAIHHLAVDPEYRQMGYGRGQILEILALKKPVTLTAEMDEDAVEFYRNIGFSISSLGELYPGTERFRCVYEAEPEIE